MERERALEIVRQVAGEGNWQPVQSRSSHTFLSDSSVIKLTDAPEGTRTPNFLIRRPNGTG